jgi:3'-5' exoribonuclease
MLLDLNKLKKRDSVEGRLLVAEKHLQRTKDGKPYLRLQLMNRTGSMEAVLWDGAESAYDLLAGSPHPVVEIKGEVVLYQQERRIRLHAVSPASPEKAQIEDFLPASLRDPEEMAAELQQRIRKVGNPFLRLLLETVFRDPEIWEPFRNAPAAKMVHHACRGGLLEHTLSLARLVQLVCKHYPFLDGDLLLTAALVHDLGKAWEIRSDAGFEYSDEGRLLGHILLGAEILEKKIEGIPEFPRSLAMNLKHIVISHHGELEFGSPKRPMTLEALCLHALDNLDAKLWGIHDFLGKEASPGKRWTSFHRVHQQHFYIPDTYPQAEEPVEDRKDDLEEAPLDLFDYPVEADAVARRRKPGAVHGRGSGREGTKVKGQRNEGSGIRGQGPTPDPDR